MNYVAGFFETIGRYLILMKKVFSKPEKLPVYTKLVVQETMKSVINSIGIVIIISFFMGAVVAIQMGLNLENPFIPRYLIGYTTRETILLEFSSTIVALILAGKVGSNISSELGTMRITDQIDALEVMGINSASYLILPKIVAVVLFFPFLTAISMGVGIIGGYFAAFTTTNIGIENYVEGIRYAFNPFYITYSLVKAAVFAFLISSIASFYGYEPKGNSLAVGRASTLAVVVSSVAILVFNLLLTNLMLVK